MASVMFSTLGQAVGGPLGAAVGASIGASMDGALFGQGRRGQDLLVQRSSYGEIVPRLFGRTRVAGQLIWCLPLETSGRKGSGRRAAGTSFAIALSSGPILDIGRIWADGREIRGSDGRFEAATTMRVHRGDVGQLPDPLIVAAEAEGFSPDYRGLAYVVFENFALGAFGNRIPNLSFEVIADAGDAGSWLASLGEAGGFAGGGASTLELTGFAAASPRLVEDADLLARAVGAIPALRGGSLGFLPGRTFELLAKDLLESDGRVADLTAAARPAGLSLGYFDPERDYQTGRQRVFRARTGAEIEGGGALTATAPVAGELANRLLREAEAGCETLRFGLSWRWLDIAVGDAVRIDGGLWRIVRRDIEGLSLWFEAERVWSGVGLAPAAEPGRSLPAPAVVASVTRLRSFEAPVALAADGGAQVYVAAAGEAGWRGCEIRHLSGGEEIALGTADGSGALGVLLEPLESGPETLWDTRNSLLVGGADGGRFESRSEEDVLAGANLLLVGDELLQFCHARAVAPDVVRLSGLLRGRFGTGFLMGRVEAGERLHLLRADTLARVRIQPDGVGRTLVLLALGAGDPPGGTEGEHVVRGDGLGPLAPVHLRAHRLADGSIRAEWVPRSRENWNWGAVEIAAPTAFRWYFLGDGGEAASLPVAGTGIEVTMAQQESMLGGAFPPGVCWVEALGEGPLLQRRSGMMRIGGI